MTQRSGQPGTDGDTVSPMVTDASVEEHHELVACLLLDVIVVVMAVVVLFSMAIGWIK